MLHPVSTSPLPEHKSSTYLPQHRTLANPRINLNHTPLADPLRLHYCPNFHHGPVFYHYSVDGGALCADRAALADDAVAADCDGAVGGYELCAGVDYGVRTDGDGVDPD